MAHHPYNGVDILPNRFDLGSRDNIETDSLQLSREVYISGINTQVDISIIEGEYSINAGTFTDLDGVVSNGDAIVIRHRPSNKREAQVITKLMVGDLLVEFSSATVGAVDNNREQGRASGGWIGAG